MSLNLNQLQPEQRARVILVIIMLLCNFNNSQAQLVSPAVTDLAAFHFTNNFAVVDMSVGELATTTIRSQSIIITQGFLQPVRIIHPCSDPVLEVYPNPVRDNITFIAVACDLSVSYIEAYDLFGKTVLVAQAVNNTVELSSIGVGVYVLRAYSENGQLVGTVKIVKTTV